MDEVYTIWVGEYSDRDVIGIAYDKEIAKAYAKLHCGSVDTTPIITDTNFITRANAMIREWTFYVRNGQISTTRKRFVEPKDRKEEVEEINMTWLRRKDGKPSIEHRVRVYEVEDEERARKIASDKLMKFKFEKMERDLLNEDKG